MGIIATQTFVHHLRGLVINSGKDQIVHHQIMQMHDSFCCLSAHLESGHYFNPHAQRIIEGKMAGAKLAVIDPRLSNTASMADYWLPSYPGTESALLLAIANVLLEEESVRSQFRARLGELARVSQGGTF